MGVRNLPASRDAPLPHGESRRVVDARLAACPRDRSLAPPPPPTQEVDETFASGQEGFGTEDQEPTDIHELNRTGVLQTVYFAFNSFDLTPSTQSVLRQNADWLMDHGDFALVVQGHCDERGTIEYNLALGEKRANSVRDYLENLGVARSRVRIVTYGEERPAEPGKDESAWSQNRRAEFLLEE